MGAAFSLDRIRCLMRAEAFISVILFACSMYMFFMVGYFTSTNRKILSLIFGVLGGLILIGGVITTSYAVTIWRDLTKDDDVQTPESLEKKVRFSSLVEIYESNEEKPDKEEKDESDHEYEEICPPTPMKEELVKDKHPKVKSSCQQENLEAGPYPQLFHFPVEDDEKLQNRNIYREACKVYLEYKNSYGTFEGIYQNFPTRNIEEEEHEDDDEIII